MTKENNGRAARRLLIQRLSIVLASFLVCLGCLHILGIGKAAAAANNNRRGGGHNDKHIPHDILKDRSMVRRNGFARNTKEHHSSHNTNGPDIVHVTFDTSESTTTTADEIQLLLLNAQVHLVDIVSTDTDSPVTQNQIFGDFCTLNFAAHKKDPSAVPMFRHLVEASPHCAKVRYRVNLHDYMKHATLYDAKPKAATKALHLTAVVFHESRCGSTLVSNALVAMNPTKHRVYSESAPPIDALRTICGETYHSCTPKVASRILQQVVYAMSRTNDLREERVFFKIQSVGTRNIEVFQLAFPKVPFLFVYRDPVQVLMSQLSGVPGGTKNANCVRPRARPPASVVDLCQRKGIKKISDLSNEEYCAAHLASITEAALHGIGTSNGMGIPINYVDLPHILWEKILVQIGVNVSAGEIEKMKEISTQYSKGGDGRKAEFHQDSERKEKLASDEVREASTLFLQESYDALQALRIV